MTGFLVALAGFGLMLWLMFRKRRTTPGRPHDAATSTVPYADAAADRADGTAAACDGSSGDGCDGGGGGDGGGD